MHRNTRAAKGLRTPVGRVDKADQKLRRVVLAWKGVQGWALTFNGET